MGKKLNLIGKKFGRLKVIRFSHSDGRTFWECRCDCGKIIITKGVWLNYGNVKSCGCLQRETVSISSRSHGLSDSRFYIIWKGIKRRCENKKAKCFKHYGSRGIKCLWKSFEHFRDDMYVGYLAHIKRFGKKETSIDRKDNDGDYCLENCRWATKSQQMKNRRPVSDGTKQKMRESALIRMKERPFTNPSLVAPWNKR